MKLVVNVSKNAVLLAFVKMLILNILKKKDLLMNIYIYCK